jgi:acetyltransferase
VTQLGSALLERLLRFEAGEEIALLATTSADGREIAVGEARYARTDTPVEREFAVAVADDWQRTGLGTRLLEALLRYAQRSGVSRVFGDVLASNEPMLRLAERFGFSEHRHPTDARLRRVIRTLAVARETAAADRWAAAI